MDGLDGRRRSPAVHAYPSPWSAVPDRAGGRGGICNGQPWRSRRCLPLPPLLRDSGGAQALIDRYADDQGSEHAHRGSNAEDLAVLLKECSSDQPGEMIDTSPQIGIGEHRRAEDLVKAIQPEGGQG